MEATKLIEILELKEKPLEELRIRYKELFGQEPVSNNTVFLWRKIAYRLQEEQYGGLSEEAKAKLIEFISRYDPINNKALRPEGISQEANAKRTPIRDLRLPIPGTVITKDYKNQAIEVKVLEKGFEYQGRPFRSLSAIAKEITGAHWNGYLFFDL